MYVHTASFSVSNVYAGLSVPSPSAVMRPNFFRTRRRWLLRFGSVRCVALRCVAVLCVLTTRHGNEREQGVPTGVLQASKKDAHVSRTRPPRSVHAYRSTGAAGTRWAPKIPGWKESSSFWGKTHADPDKYFQLSIAELALFARGAFASREIQSSVERWNLRFWFSSDCWSEILVEWIWTPVPVVWMTKSNCLNWSFSTSSDKKGMEFHCTVTEINVRSYKIAEWSL